MGVLMQLLIFNWLMFKIKDAVKLMRQAVERDPDEKEYSAIAFTKTPPSPFA